MKPDRAPLADESLDSYLAYRAERMGLPNILEIAELVGVVGHGRVRVSRCDAAFGDLADLLNIPVENLERLANPVANERWRRRYLGLSVHVMHLERMRRLSAPAALTLSPHHRTLWDLRPFPFDEGTWELLGYRCPDPMCGRSQGWHHTRRIDRCDECGGPLGGKCGAVVPAEHRNTLAAALGLVHPDQDRRAACRSLLPEALKDADSGELLDLLVALACVLDPSLRTVHHAWALKKDAGAERIAIAVAQAWPLLAGWPDAFEAFALDRAMHTSRGRGDGNAGATARFLRLSEMKAPTGLSRILVDERRRLEQAGDGIGIGAVAASDLRGMRASDISRARRKGRIGVVASMRRGLFIPLLVRSEVEAISQRFAESEALNRAAARLGCGRFGIEQLSAMGLLDPDGPEIPITGHEPRVAIERLTSLARDIEQRGTAPGKDTVSLKTAFRGCGGAEKPVGPLVRAILRGDLAVHVEAGTGPVFQRIRLASEDVLALRSLAFDRTQHPDHPFVGLTSKVEAGWELNLKSERWVELLSVWPNDGKRPVIPVPWLFVTMAQGISVMEITARTGITAKSVYARLAARAVKEVAPFLYERAVALAAMSAGRVK